MAYVLAEPTAARSAPLSETSVIGWLHKNMFSSVGNAILTLISFYLVYLVVEGFYVWGIADAVWTAPGPVVDLTLDKQDPGSALTWSAPIGSGTGVLRYDVLRINQSDDFTSPTCLASGVLSTTHHDTNETGTLVHYLVRAGNICGASVGPTSSSTPRSVGTCPGSEFPLTNFLASGKSPQRD